MRALGALALAFLAPSLSGCVVAAVPVAAAGLIAKSQMKGDKSGQKDDTIEPVAADGADRKATLASTPDKTAAEDIARAEPAPTAEPVVKDEPASEESAAEESAAEESVAEESLAEESAAEPVAAEPVEAASPEPLAEDETPMGAKGASGEAEDAAADADAAEAEAEAFAAVEPNAEDAEPGVEPREADGQDAPPVLASSSYEAFVGYAVAQARKRRAGGDVTSNILVSPPDLESPQMMSCADKPPAVIIDLDNAEGTPWSQAAAVAPRTGLASLLERLRKEGVRILWLSDEPAEKAGSVRTILQFAGLTGAGTDDRLLLDAGLSDRKQLRRQQAAKNNCILAVAGDQRSDFDELYDYLRFEDAAASLDSQYGDGWFVTPPPLTAR